MCINFAHIIISIMEFQRNTAPATAHCSHHIATVTIAVVQEVVAGQEALAAVVVVADQEALVAEEGVVVVVDLQATQTMHGARMDGGQTAIPAPPPPPMKITVREY